MKRLTRLGLALVVLGLMVAMLPLVAGATSQDNTCKNQPGFSTNLEADSSGVWGSVDFTKDSGTLDLSVTEGYEVQLCIKKGSVDPAITGWLTGDHSFDVSDFPQFPGEDGDGFSHYALIFRELPDDSTTTTSTTTTSTTTTTTTVPTTVATTTPTTLPTEVSGTSIVPQIPAVIVSQVPSTTAAPATLPFTGIGDSLPGLGLALLAAGSLTLLLGRRDEEEVN